MPPTDAPLTRTGPLAGERFVLVGAGVNLVLAVELGAQGAEVVVITRDRPQQATLWRNAAGLIEPVAIDDPRANLYLAASLQFARNHVNDPTYGIVPRTVHFYATDAEGVDLPFAEAIGGTTPFPTGRDDLPFGVTFETYVIELRLLLTNKIGPLLDRYGVKLVQHEFRNGLDLATSPLLRGADHVVLAPGAWLNQLDDTEPVWAGVGLTGIVFGRPSPTAPVIMTTDLTYRIPRATDQIIGGTNYEMTVEEYSDRDPGELFNTLREEVIDKQRSFDPSFDPASCERWLIGARPLAHRIVTLDRELSETTKLTIVGGFGGSGATLMFGWVSEFIETLGHTAKFDW